MLLFVYFSSAYDCFFVDVYFMGVDDGTFEDIVFIYGFNGGLTLGILLKISGDVWIGVEIDVLFWEITEAGAGLGWETGTGNGSWLGTVLENCRFDIGVDAALFTGAGTISGFTTIDGLIGVDVI